MQTMDAALADLVRRGIITRELAKNRSSTPAELERLLGQPRRPRPRRPLSAAGIAARADKDRVATPVVDRRAGRAGRRGAWERQ